LLALPNKRLIAGDYATTNGDVCAVGALLLYDGPQDAVGRAAFFQSLVAASGLSEKERDAFTDPVLRGYSGELIDDIMCANDLKFQKRTPEQRWQRMLEWTEDQIEGDD
jgi:hypothetical protein